MGFKSKKRINFRKNLRRNHRHLSRKDKISSKKKRTKSAGVENNMFKQANILLNDPFKIKQRGRGSDLLDLVVNLDPEKNEWRQLKTNLAKLAAFDLTVPIEQKNHSDEIIHRLENKGLHFKDSS